MMCSRFCRCGRRCRARTRATVLLAVVVAALSILTVPAAASSSVGSESLSANDWTPSGVGGAEIRAAQTGIDVTPGVSDSVVRLYGAVFDRQPDGGGLEYWVDRYVSGTPLIHIGLAFMESPEWTDTYGEVVDDQFVELLYANVLDRQPDSGGGEYWRGRLADGLSRGGMLLGFSESSEYVESTGTAPPEAPPPPPETFPPLPAASGQGRRVVYSNSRQRVWWVDASETVIESYAVSGRRSTPSPGTYSVYSKSPVAWAGHDGITMNHMVRFAHGSRLAIGFHAIPRYANGAPLQTEAELGGYRSAGCVRQADADAAALYEWADLGTTVVVTT